MNGIGNLLPHSYTIGSDFIPKEFVLTNVTNSNPAIATTISPHGYHTGLVVAIDVPPQYGMRVPNIITPITISSPTTFACDHLDTSVTAPFVIPTNPPAFTQAQVIPQSGVTRNAVRTDGNF